MHAHHFLQYGVSASPAIRLNTPEWPESRQVRSFFIPSDRPHEIELTGRDTVSMVWLDPEYKHRYTASDYGETEISIDDLESQIKPLIAKPLDCGIAGEIRRIITGRTAPDLASPDERIVESIRWIKQHLVEQTITAEQLAGIVYLSPSRFMHLFSEQIGIPVRRFILWQRLKQSLLFLAEGRSITEAAHEAGFTDSPHMNRTFNAMFGITPSKIFKNSRFIQVISC